MTETTADNTLASDIIVSDTAVSETAGAGTAHGVAGLVALLTDRALAMSVQAPRAPSSVRISAGDVEVEISWAVSHPAAAATAGSQGDAGETPSSVRAEEYGPHPNGAAPDAPAERTDVFPLCASTVGTFYRAPEPGAAPFVTEGDTIRPGQQVALIEAMKLMIPVEAERAGEVAEILVADRAPVEYGQPLMLLREGGQ
jgi:acetyl-CoA carboxylase biotin carboxyl carrier protein